MTEDNSYDIDELTERAKVLAEATGREESDVLADLLDDGILNNSHLSPDKDLVTQLKEAAALITTVQEINTDISNNKVLNGGENATSVKVETTLEGDIVDRAIASAQKKAENLKTLIATIIPIFLLITGGSMEAFGIIDIIGNSEDEPEVIYGCTDDTALNYNLEATDDDGLCQFEIIEPEPIYGCMDSEANNHDTEATEDDGSCEYTVEQDCTSEIVNHYRGHVASDSEQNDILVAFKVQPDDCQDLDLVVSVELYQEGYAANYTYLETVSGSSEHEVSHTFVDVEVGYWIPKVKVSLDDEELENVNFWGIDVEQQEDETIYGCTDTQANNYDEQATEDDGSCEYDEPETCEDSFNHIDSLLYVYDTNSIEVGIEVENTVAGCETEIQVSISLYQDGLFYDSLAYDHLPTYTIGYSVEELLVVEDLFASLDDGNWDALVKIRDANTLEEYYTQIHTNVVSVPA